MSVGSKQRIPFLLAGGDLGAGMKKTWWKSLQVRIVAWFFVPKLIILSAVAWFTFYSYEKVLGDLAVRQDWATRPTNEPATDLTEREREVPNLLVQRERNRQIAEAMVISVATVKAHVSNILSKLGVARRAEAIAYAIKHKLVTL
jgi:DNA-binding CsgD family transcriptional regulator